MTEIEIMAMEGHRTKEEIKEELDKECKHQKQEDLVCLSQVTELMKVEEVSSLTEIKDNQINP